MTVGTAFRPHHVSPQVKGQQDCDKKATNHYYQTQYRWHRRVTVDLSKTKGLWKKHATNNISAGHSLWGAIRLRRILKLITSPGIQAFLLSAIVCLLVLASASNEEQVCHLWLAGTGPTDQGFHTWPGSLSLGPSRVSLEIHRFSDLLPRPSKSRKTESRVPKKLLKRHPQID